MLEIFTLEQAEQWDAVVRSFADYDVYYLSGYTKAFEIHGDGQPLLIHCHINNTRGINVVMKRDISTLPQFKGKLTEGQLFDFCTPYGYGGWLIEGDDNDSLMAAYETWCKKNRIVSEFVRFHPVLKNAEQSQQSYDVIPLGETVAMDLSSPETICRQHREY